ncbi:isoprenylcysteine carboxyl methyltransferase family protein [Candidatus Omnitrophus magneticus]|uniref:Isoprenylcysteine carboxyl methyltransferase family protein n=1 Tax=Candidatus Omnitrophus magneticus TaxID=1609969 RepID=A0A0F0CRW6_9BACT|nr:isoprenylcysteine carboxyl methyltransferase family protein [Candidatus Omnitrophus magneticus]
MVYIFFITAIFLRCISLFISITNEKQLKRAGAREYGKFNSIMLATTHILFYFCAFFEAVIKSVTIDNITFIGIAFYVFSIGILVIVIYELKGLWTIKLLIAKKHPINVSPLFKYFRHPNYFLNVIPELIGIVLICKAWFSAGFILPVYMFFLIMRIIQEEKAMAVLRRGLNPKL